MLQGLAQFCIALLQFFEQSNIFDSDHRLVGESFKQLDLSRSEGPHVGATCAQRSNEFPLLTKGSGQVGTPGGESRKLETPNLRLVLLTHVGNVERAVLTHPVILWLINTDLDTTKRYGPKMGSLNHNVLLPESQHHVINSTNPCRALDDSIEDRLHICGRPADNAEHLRRGRLMLQSLAQLCIALLDLFKEPYVFNSDHRLVGEGFK